MTQTQRHCWRCACIVAIFGALASYTGLAASSDVDTAEILRRLSFSATSPYESGSFSGHHRYYEESRQTDPESLKRESDKYRREVWASIESGRGLSEEERAELQYAGFSTAKEAINDPAFRKIINAHVDRMVGSYERAIQLQSAERREDTQFSLLAEGKSNLRYETTYDTATSGDTVLQKPGTRTILVINKDAYRQYNYESKSGLADVGTGQKPDVQELQLGLPNLMYGGRPSAFRTTWKENQVVSRSAADTPDGEAIKLVLADISPTDGTVGTTQVVWVLPGKGYSLYRNEVYLNGKLTLLQECSDYKETESGLWYPMEQHVERVEAQLGDDVARLLARGELTVASPKVLEGQVINHRSVFDATLDSVKLNIPLDKNQFDFTFPPGTDVTDLSMKSKGGEAYHYIVGKIELKPDPNIPDATARSTAPKSGSQSVPGKGSDKLSATALGTSNRFIIALVACAVIAALVIVVFRRGKRSAEHG